MRLMLSLLSCPDGARPEFRETDTEITIGRGPGSTWVLPDPTRAKKLSRVHCRLTPDGDGWHVTDLSVNGTFLNDEPERLAPNRNGKLHDGDRLRLGGYVIEVRYHAPSAPHVPPSDQAWLQPTPDDPFRMPSEVPPPRFDDPPFPGVGAGFGPRGRSDFIGQPLSDHTPATADAWQPPPARPAMPPGFDPATAAPAGAPLFRTRTEGTSPGGASPKGASPKEDDEASNATLPGFQPSRFEAPPLPAPPPTLHPGPIVATQLPPENWDPVTAPPAFSEPGTDASTPDALTVGAAAPGATVPPPTPFPTHAPVPPLPQVKVRAPDRIAPTTTSVPDGTLLAAFLKGIGVGDIGDADPPAMMERMGALLRVMVDRLRAVQIDRAAIKREFRILGTMVQLSENNPIKFSASTDAALRLLLTSERVPDRAVREILDGVRLHELAMVAAMRDAVNGLLDALDPSRLRAVSEERGFVLPLQRKARAFEQYQELHAQTVQTLADDFDSVFGKAFARAYERVALDDENTPRE